MGTPWCSGTSGDAPPDTTDLSVVAFMSPKWRLKATTCLQRLSRRLCSLLK